MKRMTRISLFSFTPLVLFGLAVALGNNPVAAQQAGNAKAPDSGVNLAVVATPSASYVSGDTTLKALSDGNTPRSSRDNRRGSWGNWNRTGTQWVQYDWSQPISTAKIDVYWWADGRGIALPKACRLKYWDGSAFVEVKNAKGLGVAGNQFNTTTFDEVRTDKLRLEVDSDGSFSTGILEWKVYDTGKSPKFPPIVNAGVDRVVILTGKTYLNGTVSSLQGGTTPTLAWSKESGPGEVVFENAHALSTTARFAKLGDYVLKLTATDGDLNAAATLQVKVDAPPPAESLKPVAMTRYKINSPLWNGRAKALIVGWIPHCYETLSNVNLREGGINNFIQAANRLAGKPYTRNTGYPFTDAYVHNTVEAMCVALMVDPQGDQAILAAQKAMRAKLEDWIPKILAAQEPDGYLQTRFTRDSRNPAHWDPRTRGDHEGYVSGYFIESAIAHYLMTGKKDSRMYNAAKKLADCWDNNIGPAPKKEWYDGHQEMEQALVRLGRFVNDNEGAGKGEKYIKLARFLLDCRKNGSEYDQSHLPVVQQYEAVGHAVRAAYTYSAMADIAMETHDADYESAAKAIWDNIVNRKYYVTGGIGSGETSEGFGPNYSLRNNAYCESCSNCGELFFQYKMNLLYHEAKYADLYEETLYNAILGDIDLVGKNFTYTNALEGGGARYPWHVCPCCVGNIPRVLLELPTWMYATGHTGNSDDLFVNLYIGSTVTVDNVAGTKVEMVQATDYPWNGKVAITVNPAQAKRFAIHLRVPNRKTSELYTPTPEVSGLISLSVNGAAQTPAIMNGYAVLDREWKAGDKIEMELPLKPQRIKASDKIEADRGRVALRVGPLVYNVERADQDITQILNSDSPLTTEWKPDLLGGVLAIKGTWANGSPLLAIPNYARLNRLPAPPQAQGQGGNTGGFSGRGRGMRTPSFTVWLKDRP